MLNSVIVKCYSPYGTLIFIFRCSTNLLPPWGIDLHFLLLFAPCPLLLYALCPMLSALCFSLLDNHNFLHIPVFT